MRYLDKLLEHTEIIAQTNIESYKETIKKIKSMSPLRQVPCRHCERSEAISKYIYTTDCFVVPPTNDRIL